MTRAQLPRLTDLGSPAITALLARRPNAARHIAEGRYGDVIHGWLAQAALCRARIAKEIGAARLELALGADLRELAASEFWADLPSDPQYAIGNVLVRRDIVDTDPNPATFTPGALPVGFKFRKNPDATTDPIREFAEYETVEPLYLDQNETLVINDGGTYTHRQTGWVRIKATRTGPHANTPTWSDETYPPGALVSTPFDSTLEVVGLWAAGGSAGLADEQVKAFAQASYSGLMGPNAAAVLAGALSNPGVRHPVYYEDIATGLGMLYLADESWAASTYWRESIHQVLLGQGPEGGEPWLGFGASIDTRGPTNYRVAVELTVQLRSPDYAKDQTALVELITERLRWYFDERPGWWLWSEEGIRTLITICDRRILTCTSATVLDTDGSAMTPSTSVRHYYLTAGGVRVTFTTPS